MIAFFCVLGSCKNKVLFLRATCRKQPVEAKANRLINSTARSNRINLK